MYNFNFHFKPVKQILRRNDVTPSAQKSLDEILKSIDEIPIRNTVTPSFQKLMDEILKSRAVTSSVNKSTDEIPKRIPVIPSVKMSIGETPIVIPFSPVKQIPESNAVTSSPQMSIDEMLASIKLPRSNAFTSSYKKSLYEFPSDIHDFYHINDYYHGNYVNSSVKKSIDETPNIAHSTPVKQIPGINDYISCLIKSISETPNIVNSKPVKQILESNAVSSSVQKSTEEIPNVAHFIWITGKQQKGGALQKSISEDTLYNISHFQALNPNFKVTIWTDNPHLVQKSIACADIALHPKSIACADLAFPSKVQVADVYKPFSSQWDGFTKREMEVLKTSILQESIRPNRNIPAGKDIAQLAILRHEPGWYFDMDTQFFEPLPKTVAPKGAIYHYDNGMMAFADTEKGRSQLDQILHINAADYDIKNDIPITKAQLAKKNDDFSYYYSNYSPNPLTTYIRNKADERNLPEHSIIRDFGSFSTYAPMQNMQTKLGQKYLDKEYLMLDLKGTHLRGKLTDTNAALYRTVNNGNIDYSTFDNLNSDYNYPSSLNEAKNQLKAHVDPIKVFNGLLGKDGNVLSIPGCKYAWASPITNKKSAEQPELPTSLGLMG